MLVRQELFPEPIEQQGGGKLHRVAAEKALKFARRAEQQHPLVDAGHGGVDVAVAVGKHLAGLEFHRLIQQPAVGTKDLQLYVTRPVADQDPLVAGIGYVKKPFLADKHPFRGVEGGGLPLPEKLGQLRLQLEVRIQDQQAVVAGIQDINAVPRDRHRLGLVHVQHAGSEILGRHGAHRLIPDLGGHRLLPAVVDIPVIGKGGGWQGEKGGQKGGGSQYLAESRHVSDHPFYSLMPEYAIVSSTELCEKIKMTMGGSMRMSATAAASPARAKPAP